METTEWKESDRMVPGRKTNVLQKTASFYQHYKMKTKKKEEEEENNWKC